MTKGALQIVVKEIVLRGKWCIDSSVGCAHAFGDSKTTNIHRRHTRGDIIWDGSVVVIIIVKNVVICLLSIYTVGSLSHPPTLS